MKTLAALAAGMLLAAGAVAADAQAKTPLRLSTAVDFLDSCFFTKAGDHHTLEELRARAKTAYDHGIRRMYFRGTGGRSYYDSKFRPKYLGEDRPGGAKLRKTIETYDPVAEYVKVCHELGMEIYYWETIFDNDIFRRYYPGMKEYDLYGESAASDPDFPKELYVEHRMNRLRPRADLPRPLAALRIRAFGRGVTNVTDRNLVLYTAPHGRPFVRYAKPFDVKLEPTPDGKDTYVHLRNLEIADPVVKFASDELDIGTDTRTPDDVRGYYADGTECDLFRSVEIVLQGDIDREHVLWGVSGLGARWGRTKRTLIARFGDFERYARGVPEYAHPWCRRRVVNIVKELYEKYPGLDGVCFSIRSHSLPACGFKEEMGGGDFFYGFSDPIVDEYRRRHGVDIRRESYDRRKFLALRGEYVTELMREVSEVVHAHGGRFQMMAPADKGVFRNENEMKIAHGSMFLWWGNTGIDDMFDVATWAKRGYVDRVLMIGTAYHQTEWTDAWKKEVKRFRAHLAGTKTDLGLHFLSAESFKGEAMKLFPQLVADENLDEIEFYEEFHLPYDDPKIYPTIKRVYESSGRALYVPARAPVRMSQAIDFLDNCYFSRSPEGYYTKEELRRDMEQAKAAGVGKVYFRDAPGCAYYKSKLRHLFPGEFRRDWAQKLVKTISAYDPVAEYIKVCRELGMEFYYWHPIFDKGGYLMANFPGMKDYEKWGFHPFLDRALRREHCLEHRRNADTPVANLPRPIAKIRVLARGGNVPADVTEKDFLLFTGPHDSPFKPYEKPFKVTLEPARGGTYLVFSGLEITDPVVKFASDTRSFTTGTQYEDDVRAYYADGSEVRLYRSVEWTWCGDRDRLHVQRGTAGQFATWGSVDGGWGRPSLIARFGDFERYALGVPEYAYADNRQRLVDIVKELYELYPDLGGVLFSIRSHNLPSCGFKEEMGGGNFFYGFGEPIVAEYRKRYGTDPRTQPYDQKKFLKLRGEFISQMLDEVGAVVHAHGGKLEMMAPVDPAMFDGMTNPTVESRFAHGSMFPWYRDVSIDDYFDVETWAKRGSVDLVMMLGTGHRQPVWNQRCRDEVARFRAKLVGTKTKLGMQLLVSNLQTDHVTVGNVLPGMLEEEGLSEIEIYEQKSMINHPASYDAMTKALKASGRRW